MFLKKKKKVFENSKLEEKKGWYRYSTLLGRNDYCNSHAGLFFLFFLIYSAQDTLHGPWEGGVILFTLLTHVLQQPFYYNQSLKTIFCDSV